jgi:hypothetical protein
MPGFNFVEISKTSLIKVSRMFSPANRIFSRSFQIAYWRAVLLRQFPPIVSNTHNAFIGVRNSWLTFRQKTALRLIGRIRSSTQFHAPDPRLAQTDAAYHS